MLNWLKKGAYKTLSEVLAAIRKEIVSLQPRDTDSIKWTKGLAGMEAHVVNVGGVDNTETTVQDDQIGDDDRFKGHFQLYHYTDSTTNYEFVAVMNTENDFDDVLLALPSQVVISYKGTTTTYSSTHDINTFRINFTSLVEGDNYNVYLMLPFMKPAYIQVFTNSQPSYDSGMEYVYIGKVVKSQGMPVLTQAYKAGVMYFTSAQYFGAFKLINSSYTTTVKNEEGEDEEVTVPQVSVLNPEGDIAQVCKLNNATAQFASRVDVAAGNGNHVYVHAQAGGTNGEEDSPPEAYDKTSGADWVFTIEAGEVMPSSKAWDVYYRIGTIGSDGRISQIHTGSTVVMSWYFICPPEPEPEPKPKPELEGDDQ